MSLLAFVTYLIKGSRWPRLAGEVAAVAPMVDTERHVAAVGDRRRVTSPTKTCALLCCRSLRTIDVTLGEHLGSNRVTVEGPGNAHVRRKVDECLHDLLWGHPAVQSNP